MSASREYDDDLDYDLDDGYPDDDYLDDDELSDEAGNGGGPPPGDRERAA